MEAKNEMLCPDCGVKMNRHAEKVDLSKALGNHTSVDQDFYGVIQEFHTCPDCGKTHSREAS